MQFIVKNVDNFPEEKKNHRKLAPKAVQVCLSPDKHIYISEIF